MKSWNEHTREQIQLLLWGALRDTALLDGLIEIINDEKAHSYGVGWRDAERRFNTQKVGRSHDYPGSQLDQSHAPDAPEEA